jgi:hypothetical protein
MTVETAMGWRKRALSKSAFAERQKQDAIAYAAWIAQRDGLLTSLKRDASPYVIYAETADGSERPRTVVWVDPDRVYNKARGSYTVNKELLRVDIPHWDWTPVPPVEEQLDLRAP